MTSQTITVEFTPLEAKALRLASIFGTPDPTPPEIESALAKLRAAEQGASGAL